MDGYWESPFDYSQGVVRALRWSTKYTKDTKKGKAAGANELLELKRMGGKDNSFQFA